MILLLSQNTKWSHQQVFPAFDTKIRTLLGLSDSCQSQLSFALLVFDWLDAGSWIERIGTEESNLQLCIAENLGRQLNTDWKFTECCSTHFRFIWKQALNVSGTNMPMGGKLGETSSGTIPTPLLHGISSGFRTSKSKGTKHFSCAHTSTKSEPEILRLVFQFYNSWEPFSFSVYVISSWESKVFINNRVTIPCKGSVQNRQLLVVDCCWRGGGHRVTSHYVPMSPHRQPRQYQADPKLRISLRAKSIIHTAGAAERDFFSRI